MYAGIRHQMRNLFSSSSTGISSLHPEDGDRLEGSSYLKAAMIHSATRSTSSLDQLKRFDAADDGTTGHGMQRSPMQGGGLSDSDQCVPRMFGGSIDCRGDEESGEEDDDEEGQSGGVREEEEKEDTMSVMMQDYEEDVYDSEWHRLEDPEAPKTINSLPVEILALILSQVPQVDTVRSCSLVSRKWESAAKVWHPEPTSGARYS